MEKFHKFTPSRLANQSPRLSHFNRKQATLEEHGLPTSHMIPYRTTTPRSSNMRLSLLNHTSTTRTNPAHWMTLNNRLTQTVNSLKIFFSCQLCGSSQNTKPSTSGRSFSSWPIQRTCLKGFPQTGHTRVSFSSLASLSLL